MISGISNLINLEKYKNMSPLPDVGDFIFVFVIWISLFVIPHIFYQDGSTGWHLVAGNYIIENSAIPYTDLVSYTFPDKAWVAYEWLFDLGIAWLVKLGGTNLLASVLAATIGFIFLYVYDSCRESGCNILISSFLTVVAILVSAIHWLARPHLLTYIFVLVFIFYLNRFYEEKTTTKHLFIALSITMLLWTNCHPSFALGCIVALIYFTVTFFQSFLAKQETVRLRAKNQSITLFVLMAVLTLVTLINPYGINLHAYILDYLQGQEIIKGTNEFMSPVFHGGLHETCLEILFIAFVAGLAQKRKLKTPYLLVCIAFAHASLSGIRSMPMFAIIATPAIAYLWAKPDTIEEKEDSSNPGFIARIKTTLLNFQEQEGISKMHLVPIIITLVLIVASLNGGVILNKTIVDSGFSEKNVPVKTLAYLKENRLFKEPGLNLDNWGGYLRYKLNHRVFIDDRADFYEFKFYYEYSKMMSAGEGWKELIQKNNFKWILFPKNSVLANKLRQEKDWKEVSSDQSSALFTLVDKK